MQIAMGHLVPISSHDDSHQCHHKVLSTETFEALVKNAWPHVRSPATADSLIEKKEALHNANVVLHEVKFHWSKGPAKTLRANKKNKTQSPTFFTMFYLLDLSKHILYTSSGHHQQTMQQ